MAADSISSRSNDRSVVHRSHHGNSHTSTMHSAIPGGYYQKSVTTSNGPTQYYETSTRGAVTGTHHLAHGSGSGQLVLGGTSRGASIGYSTGHGGASITTGHGGASVGYTAGHSIHGGASMVSGYTSDAYTTGHIVNRYEGKERVVGTSVIGVERGAERLVSTTEHEGECVVHERYESQRIKMPKKIIREEVIERVYVVPETVQIEEYIEEDVDVEEKIVEVAKKIIIEKIVEVPEIEIVEKIIEIPETVVREKIREVVKVETVERVVEVPVEQIVERCVSVPQIEYKDVPIEKIVEVPEVHTEEITREVAVPQYVERDVERIHYREEAFNLERKVPVPVEAEQIVEYTLPELIPRYSKKKFPVYLPRFIEVPIARQFAEQSMLGQAEAFNARVTSLTTIQPAMSLCEIENLAKEIKDVDLVHKHHGFSANIRVEQIQKAFQTGELMNGGVAVSSRGIHTSGHHIGGIHTTGHTATYTGGATIGHGGYSGTSRSYGGATHGHVTHGHTSHAVTTHTGHTTSHGHGGIGGHVSVGGHTIGASIGRGGLKVTAN